jgi:hypothetical protein
VFALSLVVVLASYNEFRNSGKANFLSIKTTDETGYVFDFYTNGKIFEFFSDKSIVLHLAFGGSVQDVDKYF